MDKTNPEMGKRPPDGGTGDEVRHLENLIRSVGDRNTKFVLFAKLQLNDIEFVRSYFTAIKSQHDPIAVLTNTAVRKNSARFRSAAMQVAGRFDL